MKHEARVTVSRGGASRCALSLLMALICACSTAPTGAPTGAPTRLIAPVTVATLSSPAAFVPTAPASVVPTRIVSTPLQSAVESVGVAARFPDPSVSLRTPAFEPGRVGYTSNAELRSLMQGLAQDGQGAAHRTNIRLLQIGSSQTGVPLEALHFSRERAAPAPTAATASSTRPAVLLIGQQHGDEPAGSEALIVIAQELAHGALAPLLNRIDVVILPRANPDGALAERRVTADGIDTDLDHLLLRTPEAQAQAQLMREFDPVVVVDAHEYAVLDRYSNKFGAVQRFDALIQYAMTANAHEFITKASEVWFRVPVVQSLTAQGLRTEWSHTTSDDTTDKKVSMGGVQPDTRRNVSGLRNAIGFLIETRGIGLGRAHLLRRVHTQVTAISSVLNSAAGRADDLLKLRRFVEAEVTAKACQGEVIIEAEATPSEYPLLMLNSRTGADVTVNVAWNSALELIPVKRRTRPCGYWLSSDQTDAVLRLRALGVQVQRLDEVGSVRGENYTEAAHGVSTGRDVRGTIADVPGARRVRVDLVPALIDVRVGSYYVGLDQPLANLAIAALEPDTPYSFVANGLVSGVGALARVLGRPGLKMTPMQ